MSGSEQEGWQEFTEYLTNRFSTSGLTNPDAKPKAKSYNIWPVLGFSLDELKRSCSEHFTKVDKGESSDVEGYPQVLQSKYANM